MTVGKRINELMRFLFRLRGITGIMAVASLLIFAFAPSSRADQYDTLRIYWQNYLLTNAGSPSSVASTANSYWSSMNTSAGRTYLWSYLPLDSTSANLTSTFQQLE